MAWFKKKNEDDLYVRKPGESQIEETPIESAEERKEVAQNFFMEALEYAGQKQNDLANKAIGRALEYCKEEDDNFCEIQNCATSIYRRSGDYTTAFNCINRAIMADTDNLHYYETKANLFFFLKDQLSEADGTVKWKNVDEYNSIVLKHREVLRYILQKAIETDNQKEKEFAWDDLAATLYWDEPRDIVTAEKYSNNIVDALKELYGDYWQSPFQNKNAKVVLDSIQQCRATVY